MARSTQQQWFSFRQFASRSRSRQRATKAMPLRRQLRIEPLEERRLLAVVSVTTLDDTVDFNDGVTSLREAIFATNLVGGADTIQFAAALTSGGPATLTLTQGELPIVDALTIIGPGADLLTIDASGNDPTPDSILDDNIFNDGDGSRVFTIDDANADTLIDVTISSLSLTGGNVDGGGGAIYSHENLTVTLSTISGNSAGGEFTSGGGIFNDAGNLAIIASTISNNLASGVGGAIFSASQVDTSGNLTVTDSTIKGNSAFRGGGIGISGGTATVTNSAVSGNSADGEGGGIYGSNLMVTNSTISSNTAAHGGGIAGSNVTLTNSMISGNSADRGGGIYSGRGDLTVIDSTISGNSARFEGGGIFSGLFGSNMTVTGSTFSGNSAGYDGGGIYNGYLGNLTVTGSTISSNSAGHRGGGIFLGSADNTTVTLSTISGNSAGTDGGGIFSFGSSPFVSNLTVNGSTINGNSAGSNGGGIFSFGSPNFVSSLGVNGSTINGNSAGSDGGGIFSHSADATLINSTLSGNSAIGNGGGLYAFDSASAIRHSTVTLNSAGIGGGGAFIFAGSLALDHTIQAANAATFGPDLTGLIGSTFDVRFSLIGNNAHSGLAATPNRLPDVNGNLIGPAATAEPLIVSIEMAAMGDFEAGPNGDSFLFEYSVDGGAYQPLFTSSINEAGSQTYVMDNLRGTQVVLNDPLLVNGVLLTNSTFQTISAVIPDGGSQIRIRFSATNDGPNEAFAWRNLVIREQKSRSFVGAAAQYEASLDVFAAYAADPDYTISGDMFGIRSRSTPGIPGLPSDIADDSYTISPNDRQGIISEFNNGRFFGVVDTVNGVGNNTDSATWTFNNILVPIDPKLGPLIDNGGPTLTHELLAHSPARNMGDPAAVAGVGGVPEFDQRGEPFGRLFGDRIDMGAYERSSVPGLTWVVDSLADESDGNYGAGDFSLREAIGMANGNVNSLDTITFAPALTSGGPATILLTRGVLGIRDAATIVGPGQDLLTIDASGNDPTPDVNNGDGSRVFNIDDGDSATTFEFSISGLTLTGGDVSGGDVSGGGGAILSAENLTVTSSTISGNSSSGRGGGIFSYRLGSAVILSTTVTDSTISDNSAGSNGGGISGSNVTVTNSTISDNSGFGGTGISGGHVTVTNSTISRNSLGGIGGLNVTVTNSTINDNGATDRVFRDGGIRGSNVMVTNSTISGNSARDSGGGIGGFTVTVTESTISDNSADSQGGGIGGSNVTVTNSTISGNVAGRSGMPGYGVAGRNGGGISAGALTVTNGTISGNSADDSGGGISASGAVTVTNSTISGNSAGRSGGGVFNAYAGQMTLINSTITNNEAPDGQGSGVAANGFRTTVRSSIIAGNVHSDVDFVDGPTNTFQSSGYNLIGTGNATGEFVEPGDQTGVVDPLVGPLANNGGPTLTHALLPGSPAIDAGDPAAVAGMNGVPEFDQRGNPFSRVVGAAIDIGAFELPPLPPALLGDYSHNGVVDAADYSVWRNTLNTNVAPYSGADGSGNGVVDQADCGVWKTHFGQTLPAGAGGVARPESSTGVVVVASDSDTTSFAQPQDVPHVSPPSTLSDGSAAARSARGAAPPPSDAVFTMLGQRTPARSMATRTVLHSAIVDAVVSDSLLLFRRRRVDPTPGDDAVRVDDGPPNDTDSRRERMDGLGDKWIRAGRGSLEPTLIVVG